MGISPKEVILIYLNILITTSVATQEELEFYKLDDKKIREIPKYLKICHSKSETFDKCGKESLEKFMKSVVEDSEKYNLPNIDPIEVPVVNFQEGSGNVSVHMIFKDLTITGFSLFKILNVKSNLADTKFEILMETPFVNLKAQYSAKGGIYTFPISSQGDFQLNLTKVSVVLILRLTRINLSGLSFFTVEECVVDLLPSEIKGYFGHFIDGSNAIGVAFNTFFNNNALEIFTSIKPNLSGILGNVFQSIANEILSRHPDDVLLPS